MKTTLFIALFFSFEVNFPAAVSQEIPFIISVAFSEVDTNARTTYDLQSLSSAHMIEMNPSNPFEIHACFLVSTDPPPGYLNRNVRYFYTSNGGTTWDYIGNVAQTRAGFPVLAFTNDSRAIVLTTSSDNGGLRTQLYIDIAPGAGTWSTLDPGLVNSIAPLNPVGVVSLTNNKLYFTASSYKNACTNLNSPGTFIGYTNIDSSSPTMSAVGLSASNKVGIAFITTLHTNVPPGSVKFIESTDEGITWSEPTNVWIANYNTDSLGALRGIDCGYEDETANVVFEVCKRDQNGSYRPKEFSKIMFWAPDINNGVPVKVDSVRGLSGSNPVNDVMSSVCRPVIGYMYSYNHVIYKGIFYSRARQDTSNAGNNFFDSYVSIANINGSDWSVPFKLTNNSGPIRDYRFQSVSNKNSFSIPVGIFNTVLQSDSIPGSSVNGATSSSAQMIYCKVSVHNFLPGITQISSEIPQKYSLKQNYPNPFNPVTQIEFSVPENSFVKLKIFNSVGELVSILAESELNRGTYKVDFNAAKFASGVYYYIMEYTEKNSGKGNSISKKMVLIK